MLDIEIAEHAERQRADKVDEQILHRVVQADIEIAVKAQILSIDGDGGDVVNRNGNILVRRVKHNRRDCVHDRVLLHIHVEQPVHAELKKLPQNADGHREAERDKRHINRGQLELDLVIPVQNIDECKAERCAQKTRRCVEDGIPVGDIDEKAAQLTQNFRSEDEHQNDDLQCAWQLDAEVFLHKQRQQKQKQHQQADCRVFIFAAQDRRDEDCHDNQTQNDIDRKYGGLFFCFREQPQPLLTVLFLHIQIPQSLVKKIVPEIYAKNKRKNVKDL